MWIKFDSIEEAGECQRNMQAAVDAEHRPGPKEIILPVRTYDGMRAIPVSAEIEHSGELVESIEPPVVEEL